MRALWSHSAIHQITLVPCFIKLNVSGALLRAFFSQDDWNHSYDSLAELAHTTKEKGWAWIVRNHRSNGKDREDKKDTPPPWRPSFFFRVWGSMVYTLLSGPMVYTLFSCFPRKMVYTIAFFALWPRGRATDQEKRGPTVVCLLFFPWTAKKKKRPRPPPKENLLGNFSGLNENFPGRWWIKTKNKTGKPYLPPKLSGLKNANAKRRVFWTQRTWTQALAPREVFKSQKPIAMRFLNASVLERRSLNRNLSWAFH